MQPEEILSPIVIFNFNRPEFTRQQLRRIADLNFTRVYLACDGPRLGVSEDVERVNQVRKILQDVRLKGEVVRIFHSENQGLRKMFESTLDLVFERENRAIILEDDCVLDQSFFDFADTALAKFEHDGHIGCVAAHNPMPIPGSALVGLDVYPRIWGWATWSRVWKAYRFQESLHSQRHNSHERKRVLSRIRPFTTRYLFSRLLNSGLAEHTWDIEFAFFFISSRFTSVYPPVNMVQNVGLNGGTNRHDWSWAELPKSKPFPIDQMNWSGGTPGTLFYAMSDLRRVWRWSILALRSPLAAVKKFFHR